MLLIRPRRSRNTGPRLAHLGLACLLVLGVSVSPATAASKGYAIDLGARSDFVAQKTFVQCVGASMQMMLNMIQPGADRSAATQLRLQQLASEWSGPRPEGFEREGASVRGWATGLNLLGAGPYELVGEETIEAALRTAARAIRLTGKPVGLLMWHAKRGVRSPPVRPPRHLTPDGQAPVPAR